MQWVELQGQLPPSRDAEGCWESDQVTWYEPNLWN